MPIELRDRSATMRGAVTVDDVEPFVAWLRANPKARVNLRDCTHLHTAVLQAMLVFHPRISIPPNDPFLAEHVMPMLTS